MIYRYCNNNYPEDPVRMLNFTASNNIDFFYGIDAPNASKSIPRDKKRVLLTFERSHDFDQVSKDFDQILMIHKYYDKWREKIDPSGCTWKYVYYPLPERIATSEVNYESKTYDVAYAGFGFQANLRELVLNPIFDFKYAYVSMDRNSLVTHSNVSYDEKISVLHQSKIAIVHNVIIERPEQSGCSIMRSYVQHNTEKSKENFAWFNNGSFRTWHPELKSRIFEAAAAGCIPLVMKDDFNSVENFFTPNEDFIYFEPGKLKETIETVISNYNSYKKIAISAKLKCKKYTDTQFSKDFLGSR